MKLKLILICFMTFFSITKCLPPAITFSGGGRLGDKLMVYCKAKWFSYKFNVEFFCPEFMYKDQLILASKDLALTAQVENTYKYKKLVKIEEDFIPLKNDTLYVVDFYAHSNEMSDIVTMKNVFNAHPDFLYQLRSLITPRYKAEELSMPKDKISLAVHVRRGSGNDMPLLNGASTLSSNQQYSDKKWPTKFPPDEFYLSYIKEISQQLGNQPIYVYLFTDYNQPAQLVKKYNELLKMPNLTFDCRTTNSYESTIIDDMLAMAQFDYLIRPYSLYSAISYLLGNHECMMFPINSVWYNNSLVINKVFIGTKNEHGILVKDIVIKEVRFP